MKFESVAAQSTGQRPCVNCGAQDGGAYCPICGQRQLAGRHTLRSLIRGIVDRVFSIETGLLHTVVQLTIRPGPMIREYLAGRTIPYMHPAAYVLVSAGTFALSSTMFGGPTGAAEEDRVFGLLLIPFVAGASRIIFLRGRYNVAEHLISVMYLSAHVLLLLAVLFVAAPLVPGRMFAPFGITSLAVAAVYFLWGYSQLFPGRTILAGLAGVAALLFGVLSWFVGMLWLLSWIRR